MLTQSKQSNTKWEVQALDSLWVPISDPQTSSNPKARDGIGLLNIYRVPSGNKSISAEDVSAKYKVAVKDVLNLERQTVIQTSLNTYKNS